MEAEGELFGKRKETSVRGLGDKKEKWCGEYDQSGLYTYLKMS
jgi:hypothetical protein